MAYGDTAAKAYEGAVLKIREASWLEACMQKLSIDPHLADTILAPHGGALPRPRSPFD